MSSDALPDLGQLRNLLQARGWRLRFPGALERDYQQHYARNQLGSMRLAVTIGIIGLVLSSLIDTLLLPDLAAGMWRIRLMALAILCGGLGLSFLPNFLPGLLHYAQFINCLVVVLITPLFERFALLLPPPFSHYYHSAIVLVMLVAFVISRLQFYWGLVCALIMAIEVNVILTHQGLETRLLIVNNYIFLLAGLFSLTGAFLLERSDRQHFLLTRLLSIKREDLSSTNMRLQYLTDADALTGIGNRRALDRQMDLEWRRCQREQVPLTLLLIDADLFKPYNDHLGHPEGDACLRAIGDVLAGFARRSGELAARYGGEEFALLRPSMSLKQAAVLAEEVLVAIRSLNRPHPTSPYGHVTVSIGIASYIPDPNSGPSDLIQLADGALYQAKHRGRNRAEVAATPPPTDPAENVLAE